MTFPVTGYINIKLHAQSVADAAHLCYWLEAEQGRADYHRDDLLAQADRLEAMVNELRASLGCAKRDPAGELLEALRPFADIGIGENPDYEPMIRVDRAAIVKARAAVDHAKATGSEAAA